VAHAQSAGVARAWAPLTGFVGREREAAAVADLLRELRLVTVTGPGGVGKTRLAVEVMHAAADGFPDGTFFVGLGTVADPARVAGEVAAALGVREAPGRPVSAVLGEVLAPRRLLLVLDNCEHVLDAVAKLCGDLLIATDDVRILATSREQLWVGGEARYRLAPLTLPRSDDPEEIGRSEAVTLFAERARRAVPGFALSRQDAPLAARVAARLDGMPLAIELAAARVEALGLAGLADRIDDALQLLTSKNAADRHQSLVAVADWSYRLLSGPEQAVFRRLSAFPRPFTLEAATAVAGPGAEPVVLRLVDCSLLVPPQSEPDGRARYMMLETLRAYGLDRLTRAGEEQETSAALAGFALSVAQQATKWLLEDSDQDRELAALRWLDAEDATLSRALSWAIDNDPGLALCLAAALAPWLRLRGRIAEAHDRLVAVLAHACPSDEGWAMARLWLGHLLSASTDLAASIDCFTAVIDAHRSRVQPRELVGALVGRTVVRLNAGEDPATVHDARRALELARAAGYPAGELEALTGLSLTAFYAGDAAGVARWARQAQELLPSGIPAIHARWSCVALATVLTETGELDFARRLCGTGLALSRQVEDQSSLSYLLTIMATLERQAGNLAEARAHLSEGAGIALRSGDHADQANFVNEGGYQCAATGRWADAVTLWAAHTADRDRRGLPAEPGDNQNRAEYLEQIEQALDAGQLREAEERGARTPIPAAVELVIVLSAAPQAESPVPAPGKLLSPRERELVTLVAEGHTNAEVAARLHISARTVTSHLDRIRDKTGYRRRADLTRLALEEKLV
jgi:predicted ATPase/DNA-binding CsgD family transcriptional regulator